MKAAQEPRQTFKHKKWIEIRIWNNNDFKIISIFAIRHTVLRKNVISCVQIHRCMLFTPSPSLSLSLSLALSLPRLFASSSAEWSVFLCVRFRFYSLTVTNRENNKRREICCKSTGNIDADWKEAKQREKYVANEQQPMSRPEWKWFLNTRKLITKV